MVNFCQSTCQLWQWIQVINNFIANYGKIWKCSQGKILFIVVWIFVIYFHKIQVEYDSLTSNPFHYSGVTSSCTNWYEILSLHLMVYIVCYKMKCRSEATSQGLSHFMLLAYVLQTFHKKEGFMQCDCSRIEARGTWLWFPIQVSCPSWIRLLHFIHNVVNKIRMKPNRFRKTQKFCRKQG